MWRSDGLRPVFPNHRAVVPSIAVLLRLRWLQLRLVLRVLEAIIRRWAERGRTVIITSHMLGPLIAICDRINLLQHVWFEREFEHGHMEGSEALLFMELCERTRSVMPGWGAYGAPGHPLDISGLSCGPFEKQATHRGPMLVLEVCAITIHPRCWRC